VSQGVGEPKEEVGVGQRVLGAFLLRRDAYREIAANPSVLVEAAVLTLVTGAAQTIALAGIWPDEESAMSLARIATSFSVALASWIVPTIVLWAVAKRFVHGRSVALDALLRAAGYASAPGLLYVGACALRIAALGDEAVLAFVATGWLLTQAALFIAVQETLETRALRTLAIFLVAGILTAIAGLALSAVLPAEVWQSLVL
jgi:hypothetical protein